MKYIFFISALLICSITIGQGITKRALFLGNSYTAGNNLPLMISNCAISTGDILIYDSNLPGGHTFQGHSTNATSLAKIELGNWDYVVLQEQSQRPSFPISQVESDVFPYARFLDSTINVHNNCAETVFYMTWGRKNGDASNCATWPPVCTYVGMDSLLNLRYRMMAEDNDAIVSPVGAVWKYIRENFPLIELYLGDESHPTVEGTYAAACCFYTTFYRKDPSLITFNSTLSTTVAENIRTATKIIVYDNLLEWHIGEYDPMANFTYHVSGLNEISFTNTSTNSSDYFWDFGDGNTSTIENPTHLYSTNGIYSVKLIANHCGYSDSTILTVNTNAVSISQNNKNNELMIYPNPVNNFIYLNLDNSTPITYQIINYTGQEVQSGIISNDKQINVSLLTEGIYFLFLYENNEYFEKQKFVKIAN